MHRFFTHVKSCPQCHENRTRGKSLDIVNASVTVSASIAMIIYDISCHIVFSLQKEKEKILKTLSPRYNKRMFYVVKKLCILLYFFSRETKFGILV